jgi:sodium/hydrogen exchanger 10/11
MASLTELYKKVNSITAVQPSPPKVIFKEVAWMADDEVVIDFLFENVTVKKFEPGDVVFGLGNVADGIYIVVTGFPNHDLITS